MSPSQRGELRRPVIDAIISARDEELTVAAVVSACLAAPVVREVIVVDDGSLDETAAVAAAAGAKVVPSQGADTVDAGSATTGHGRPAARYDGRPLRRALAGMARRALLGASGADTGITGDPAVQDLHRPAQGTQGPECSGSPDAPARKPGSKAHAMAAGVAVSDAEVFLFLDADLLGVTAAHLESLCRPIIDGAAEMSVGWLDYRHWNPVVLRLPPSTGQRVVPRWVFEAVPSWRRSGYKMEILLNEVIAEGRARTAACFLEGVTHRTKKDKLGQEEGSRQTWQMFWTLAGMPMTGEVRWRTFWFYWKGLTVLPPAGPATEVLVVEGL